MSARDANSPPSFDDGRTVHEFDLYRPDPMDVDYFRAVRQMHEQGLPDVFWTPLNGGHWVALRGDAILDVTKDPAAFSSIRMLVPDEANFESGTLLPLMCDPPDHSMYRRVIMSMFSPERVNKLEAAIREFAVGLISELVPRKKCEFVSEFSLQMPIVVFLKLLDLPLSHRLPLLELEEKVVTSGDERDGVLKRVIAYLSPIIDERKADPHVDVISELTQARVEGDRMLTKSELLGLATTLLLGGLDTVAATLGFVTRFLAENPDVRRQLRTEPNLMRKAIEELMRRFPVTTHGRYALKEVEFRGVTIRKHDHIIWTAGMYNFDHRIFPDPMTVDFNRPRTIHLSFGAGIHSCIGAALARLEIKIFLEEWLKRIPDFEVARDAQIRLRPGINYALHKLPLTWS